MDYFLNDKNAIKRIVDEWRKYGKIIIAYDFDDTVYDFHNKGRTYNDVADLLRECKKYGAYLIVFTGCKEDKYKFIKNYLNENNIPYDKINENMEFADFTGRKIYYNVLLDDRAGLSSSYKILKRSLEELIDG